MVYGSGNVIAKMGRIGWRKKKKKTSRQKVRKGKPRANGYEHDQV
jgi:hypothetical protein